ncbi:MAG: arginine deiminase-related protein [Candidatus Korarchaeum sp.]
MPSDVTFSALIVRGLPDSYAHCVSTNPLKKSLDLSLARKQWRDYVSTLRESGIEVIELEPLHSYPDSVFIQDTALVGHSGRALLASFGEGSRRGEEESVGRFLEARGFSVGRVDPPGSLEGGDVLITSEGVAFVGLSSRTNELGAKSFEAMFGLRVVRVRITRTFHLLSGVSYLGGGTVALSPSLVDPSPFRGFRIIYVPDEEVYASNMLYLGDRRVLMPSGFERTEEKLRREGFKPLSVDLSEFWKCDGGATCLSLPIYYAL